MGPDEPTNETIVATIHGTDIDGTHEIEFEMPVMSADAMITPSVTAAAISTGSYMYRSTGSTLMDAFSTLRSDLTQDIEINLLEIVERMPDGEKRKLLELLIEACEEPKEELSPLNTKEDYLYRILRHSKKI